MAAVPTWTIFCYFNADANGERDERREIMDWQVEDVLRWARHRGFDVIHLSRTEREVDFRTLDLRTGNPTPQRGIDSAP